jgi:hypothetical protein
MKAFRFSFQTVRPMISMQADLDAITASIDGREVYSVSLPPGSPGS